MQAIEQKITLPDGREMTIETGKLAKQADGSVVIKMGNAMLLAAVVSNQDAKEDMDFLPLSVDYQEKFAANGKIPGGFLKRESRLSDYEILICRLVDRALRPLFPSDYHSDTQININLISADAEVAPDALAAFAASAALSVSDIPFQGPISEVRVGRVNGEFVVNPPISDFENLDIDIIIAADKDNVMMVEGEFNECSESDLLEAIRVGHEVIKMQCQAQIELAEKVGATEKRTYEHEKSDPELQAEIEAFASEKVKTIARQGLDKESRKNAFKAIKEDFLATKSEEEQEEMSQFLFKKYFKETDKKAIRAVMLEENLRLDGRKLDEIRPIWSEVNYLPTPHGSAVFTRGETQSLTTVTLGSKKDEKMIDGAMFDGMDGFMLHYNFPAYSTGEVRPNRGPGRREIGHGNLAMRSIKKVLPDEGDNPYTIRVVSDILESNGSSSMATVCAGTLALMDAGVKIKNPVSGIAMGLITDGEKYIVLSDILGDEDHLGDMDFKVTGTKNGICAVQMDMKVDGLPYEVLTKALDQAKAGRLHILDEMAKTISEPREDQKPHVPRIVQIKIDREFIGAVIGPGGKVIQEIQRETETEISIEEKDEIGYVQIYSNNKEGLDKAIQWIKNIVAVPEIGTIYDGTVKSIMPFGAFVEILPGKDGLLHISEITWERLETMDGVMKEGDKVQVKLIGEERGKYKLSKKVLEPKPEGYVERRSSGGDRNRNRDRNRGGNRDRDRRGGGDRRDRRR